MHTYILHWYALKETRLGTTYTYLMTFFFVHYW
jgi:hypothetical protein